jgi:hypothetical protein
LLKKQPEVNLPNIGTWGKDAVSVGWHPYSGLFYRMDIKTMASTTSHPTMTTAATAPAVILAFSFVL